MTQSEIILEYHGPVNFMVIELLLKKLRKTKGYADLNKTTGKRLYAIVVECLENILKHSVLKSSDDPGKHPHISIMKGNDQIIIIAGNPVPDDAKDKLGRRLDHINQSEETVLKTIYENKINHDPKKYENGAGLGFIFMRLKSGNKISYSFNPLTDDYLYFEIQISLNKYIMRKLIIDQTSCSPKVILDPERKIFQISGESRPPDVREFYDKILSWLDDYSLHLIKSDDKKDPVIFNFNFEYFNSSSGKFILDICKVLARLRSKEINLTVNWHFEKDDADMLEVGKEMSRIVKFPFEYIETAVK